MTAVNGPRRTFNCLARLKLLRIDAVDPGEQQGRHAAALGDLVQRIARLDDVGPFQIVLPGIDHRAGKLIEQLLDFSSLRLGQIRKFVKRGQRLQRLGQFAVIESFLHLLDEGEIFLAESVIARGRFGEFAAPLAGPENGVLDRIGRQRRCRARESRDWPADCRVRAGNQRHAVVRRTGFRQTGIGRGIEGDVGRMPFGEFEPNKGVCGTKVPGERKTLHLLRRSMANRLAMGRSKNLAREFAPSARAVALDVLSAAV